MKFIILFSLVCCVAFATTASASAANFISAAFLKKILPQTREATLELADQYRVRETIRDVLAAGILARSAGAPLNARIPVLPPGPDPIPLKPDPLDFSFDNELFSGHISVRGAAIEGLSEFTDDLSTKIALLPPKVFVGYNLKVPKLSVNGEYDSEVTVDYSKLWLPLPKITYKGNGEFRLNALNAFVDVGAAAAVKLGTTKLEFKDVLTNLGFEAVDIYFENAQIDGAYVEGWEEFNEFVHFTFHVFWQPVQEWLQENITLVLNELFKDCTILQLIAMITGGGDFSCLNLPIPIAK